MVYKLIRAAREVCDKLYTVATTQEQRWTMNNTVRAYRECIYVPWLKLRTTLSLVGVEPFFTIATTPRLDI